MKPARLLVIALVIAFPLQHVSAQRTTNATNAKRGSHWWSEDLDALLLPLPQTSWPNATTGPSTWTGGTGNWSDGSMWNPTGAPNSDGADVSVDGGNATASVVSVDGSFTVGRLTIDAGDMVNVLDNRVFTLTNTGGFTGAGSIVNNGSLILTTAGNITSLSIASAVSLSGSGVVTLTRNSAVTNNSNSFIRGGGTLTNSSTIQGEGGLGANETGFVNLSGGIIQANVGSRTLVIDPNGTVGLTNSGTLRATNGGILQLTGNGGGDFTNTATGAIQANGAGSEVQLHSGARISSGTLSTSAGGIVRVLNSQSITLDGLSNTGTFIGNDNSTTLLNGTITNTGDMSMITQGNFTAFSVGTAATLTGAGTFTLGRDNAFTQSSNSIIRGGGTLTNASTIQGEGNVGINETGFINQSTGIIQANVSGRSLAIDPNGTVGLGNAGVLRATGGSTLVLTGNGGGDFVNTGTGSIQANGAGSEVQLFDSVRISGGTLSTSTGGIIRTFNSRTAFLDGLTLAGNLIGNDNSSTVISGTITDNGDITLMTDGNLTNLRIDTAATLNGTGTVTLGRNSAQTQNSNSRISGGGTLTNQTTIQGEGSVGSNEATIMNQSTGIVQANVAGRALLVDPAGGTGTFRNQGLLRALNGGVLQLTGNGGGTFNNAGGIIRAEAGSEVQLFSGVTISGGTLATQGVGALLRTLNSQTATLDSLTLSGTYTGSDNSTTILTGAINNTGDLTMTTDGNITSLRIDGSATLQAGGSVTLTRNAMLTGQSNARISGAGTLTNASTIQGEGNVAANETTIVNQVGGVIQANVGGRGLVLDAVNAANGFSNAGILRATDGGFLQFTGNAAGDFTNVGTGSIQALGMGSEVQLSSGATIHGGTLSTANGGVIRTINSHSATLDSLTNAGTYVGNDNSSTFLLGTITNNGNLMLATDGNLTDLRIDGNVTLNGTGTVTLFRNATLTAQSNSRIRGPGTLTNNSTIQGEGNIGANEMSIVNQAGGMVLANIAGRPLVIDPSGALNSYSNSGVFRAINGGLLQLSGNGGGDFINTGVGTIEAVGAGSEVQLINNATIRGGTLITSGGGLFRNPNSGSGTLDSVTNPGNFIANDNSTTFLVGTISNTGDMSFTTDGNLTNIRIDGNTTLTGVGTVTLTRNAAATASSNVRLLGGGTLTNATTLQGEGCVGLNETSLINQGIGIMQANVAGRTLLLDPSSVGGLTNSGVLRASNGGTLLLTGNGGGSFTNNIGAANGIFEALDGSSLSMDGSATLTNNVSGVLTRGSYRSVANGNGATLTIRGANITQLAASTEVILSGAGSIFQVDTTALESTLLTNDGALRVLNNRNYANTNALTDNGILELGGGIFSAPSLTIGASGELFGFGSVTVRPTNAGLVRATGGTLFLTSGLGSAGTAQSDATGILSLSSSSTSSSANFLFNNGNLALGGQNFVVNLDYNNANFGVGNSFNPRANVTGAGLIMAAGNVGQTLSGTGVVNGATATPLMAFGNVHVGDSPTRNYQINNTGTTGPSLRGALQTTANGGHITDGRLGGAGVTAGNFGPLSLGGNSGTLGVTFNATSAGALVSQLLHLINNFDNVGEQDLSITGAAFRYANPTAHTPEPIAFGNVHVGDVLTNVFLSLANNVPNDSFSEALNASIGGATGGVLINGGSFSLLAPGATNSTALGVRINTANAGNQGGTATITLQSDGTGSSGLGISSLASQTVNITGSVFRFASPSLHTPEPVVLANQHVGGTLAQALSISNTAISDGFSEALNASFTGTSGSATASGSFALLGAGATNNSSLLVGVDTSVAGPRGGTATIGFVSNGTGTSGLAPTMLTSQTVNVSGNVYRLADPSAHTPDPVVFGVHHVGESVSNIFVSLTNSAATDGFSEALNATIGSASTGLTTNGGSFTALAPGSTNNNSLSVGINTATAGARNGTATVSLQSNGAGSSNLGLTTLPSQTVNVTGQVNFFADPVITVQSGTGTVNMGSATLFTLNLGAVLQNSGTFNAVLALRNFLHDANFQDSLGGTWDLTTVNDFLLTGFGSFSGLVSGGAVNPMVGFNSAMPQGTYTDTVFLTPTSTNASGTSNLAPVQLNIQAQIVPEPSILALVMAGAGLLVAWQRVRRRA